MKQKYSFILAIAVVFGSAQASVQANYSPIPGKPLAMLGASSSTSTLASFSGLSLPAASSSVPFSTDFIQLGDEVRLKTVSVAQPHIRTAHAADSTQIPTTPSRTSTAAKPENNDAELDDSQALPKTETWAILLVGLGLIGLQLRHNNAGKIAAN